jgi:hypothetical protein
MEGRQEALIQSGFFTPRSALASFRNYLIAKPEFTLRERDLNARGFRRAFDHRQDAGAERDVVLRICPHSREPYTDLDLHAAVGKIADKNFRCRVLQGKRAAIEDSGGRTRSSAAA